MRKTKSQAAESKEWVCPYLGNKFPGAIMYVCVRRIYILESLSDLYITRHFSSTTAVIGTFRSLLWVIICLPVLLLDSV